MGKKKIAYTTSRLNRNLENVTANDSKHRWVSERSLNSALLALQYSSSRFSDYRILSDKFLRRAYYAQMIDHDSLKAKESLYLCAVCQKIACQYYKPTMQKTDGPYAVDCYEEYADLSDEEYRTSLEAKREEITAFILEQCRTKRTNLYITGSVALHFAKHFEIHCLCDRDGCNAVGNCFMSELIDQLLQEGRLVSTETTHGTAIRTATVRELKDYRKPVEQVAGQFTMM